MTRVFIDSNVPIYALGGPSVYREACRSILRRAAAGEFELHASVELVQEVLFHRMRRAHTPTALKEARLTLAACTFHAFDEQVLSDALSLVERYGLRGRDAIHAATALRAGFQEIVTVDTDFEGISDLKRRDPAGLS